MPPALRRDAGTTLIDVLIVVVLIGGATTVSVPKTADLTDAMRARQAAGFVAARARQARQEAIVTGVNVGLVFDFVGGRWLIRECRDGTGNGLRRAEIQSGADPCPEGPFDVGHLFPGLTIAV